MIPKELVRKIRYLQIYTSKAVNDSLAGEYQSVFKGQGMEFEEVREYQVGDDIRLIDWNVTARTGVPHIKNFVEERELTVIFMVDLSASGAFGSVKQIKNEVAAELCALLAFSAIKNNDKVGLIVFTDHVEMFIPPGKGPTHVLRLIRELLGFEPGGGSTDMTAAIEYLARVTTKHCVVFLVSDFYEQDFEKPLQVLSKRHDLIAVSITDPREIKLPGVGLVELEDPQTGESVVIDTGSLKVRNRYANLGEDRMKHLRTLFRSMDVDHLEILTGGNYVRGLVQFFRTRERRTRR